MRPAELADRLADGPLLLDGGLGSLLIAAGLGAGRAPDWWNLEHPERIAAAHRGYVEAGAEVIHTNTFGANPLRLAATGLGGRCREVNVAAVAVAREVAAGGVLVAGDVGPTGQMLPPLGDATEEGMERSFREQVETLAAAGVDLISIETMTDLREALAAVRAAGSVDLAVMASMTFEVRRRGTFSIMGDPLVPTLAALAEAGATAVGCNCSVTSGEMLGMVREAAPRLAVPLAAQPNAGQPRVTVEGVAYDADPASFADDLLAMVEAGARLVGGCCGSTPDFIRAIRSRLDSSVAT